MSAISLAVLDEKAARAAIPELSDVLADCVNGGASVNFMLPYGPADATKFFEKVAGSVGRGERVLVVAKIDGRIVGTGQLGLDTPPNQPHRADVMKMLVHRAARGRGVGAAVLVAVEEEARKRGRWLLVLDTASDSARRLYERGGWQNLGDIHDYAMWPEGGYCASTYYWKRL